MEALKTNVLIMRMFMSSSMKATIHLEPKHLANLEVYKNTNFQENQSLFSITQKLIMEHSEEILNVHTIHRSSPSWTRSVLSHDQVIQWTKAKSTCRLCFCTVLEQNEWQQRCNYKMVMSSGRIQNVSFFTKNCWESMEKQLNSSGIFSQDFCHCRFFRKIQDVLRERNIKPEEFTVWIIFMSMFNDIDWTRKGNDGICISNSVKSRNTRRDSRKDTGRFWVLEMKRSGLELFVAHLKENGTLQPLIWWNDSKIQVIQYSRVWVLWVVGSWKRKTERPYPSMRMLQTQSSDSESFIL